MAKSVVHWFRKGLRLHDNPSLVNAIESQLELYPVFILDPWFVKNAKVGPNRWRFLQQSLADLDTQLRSLGSRLFVIRGSPQAVFGEIFPTWKVVKLTYESDTEPYAKIRDEKVEEIAHDNNVDVVTMVSHTLYDPEVIIKKNKGTAPLTYQKMQSLMSSIGSPPKPVMTPVVLSSSNKISHKERLEDERYDVPTLKELGVDESALEECKFPGGETEGLHRLNEFVCEKNGSWVRSFEKPNTSPNSLTPSTTVLSPYLKFGCVSVRLMYENLSQVNKQGKHTMPPVSLVGQLLWREMFYTCGSFVKNFDKMEGNPICRQIPWENNREYLNAWKEGRTGYPFIDAIMTQLRKEGWIHHLARHAVACFLTRGDLWVSWEEGMKVFEEYLLDADWSLNAGNWMWLSASAFFHQYFRVYSPIGFGKKTDPRGEYIKKYLPQLRKIPEKYIFEPWMAPLAVQERAGCVIGKDYPRPIVDHAVVSKINMSRMKEVFGGTKRAGTSSESSYDEVTKKKPRSDVKLEKEIGNKKGKKQEANNRTKNSKITKYLKGKEKPT